METKKISQYEKFSGPEKSNNPKDFSRKEEKEVEKILETLSPNERKVLPHIQEKSIKEIIENTGLDSTSVLRALEFLGNKKIVKLSQESKELIELDINGVLYKKVGLPERRLLNSIAEKISIDLEEAKKSSKLNDNEFKAALGALKSKALINLSNGKIILQGKKEEVIMKSLEEQFIDSLPLELETLLPKQKLAYQNLKNRKKIVIIEKKKEIFIEILPLGKKILSFGLKDIEKTDLIEKLTPEMIKSGSWKGKKFRRYDILSQLPKISGGKRHFVNQAIDYARKIWLELGFQEMSGSLVTSGFWNFDALFTPQDHPARELHDTFFINKDSQLPDKKIVQEVKKVHEKGIEGSKGWQYSWQEKEAKKTLLRTHTTCLSAQTLAKLDLKELPAKFFAIGRCFRNETIDWGHLFEFNQTEGIVIDENASFRHLLGYLKEFAKKMGYEKVRFRPHYFPYTEPSLEGDVWNEERKEWMEVFAAGIFRPEVTEPLLGKAIPVLAWGPGFDRMLMLVYKLQDMRQLYKNDIEFLRKIKFW